VVVLVLVLQVLRPSHNVPVLHSSRPTTDSRCRACWPTTHSVNVRLVSVCVLNRGVIDEALDAAVQADRLDSKGCGEDDGDQETTQDV
jgi:hypothetical protein